MAAKQSRCSKVGAATFTSIIAPVVVAAILANIKKNEDKASPVVEASPARSGQPAPVQLGWPETATSNEMHDHLATTKRPAEITQIVVQASGRTPEEAIQLAIGSALQWAVASQVDAETWRQRGNALWAAVSHDRDLVVGWKELGADKQWKLHGTTYRKDVAVEVDRTKLKDRLRTVNHHLSRPQ